MSDPVAQAKDAGRVTKVRVFTDRAAVTRERSFEAADSEIVFAPIPIDADPRTLRAHAEVEPLDRSMARAAVPIRGVSWSVIYAEPTSVRQLQVKRELESVARKIAALDDAEESEDRTADLLQQYAGIATATLSREWLDKDPAFDRWTAVFDQLRRRRGEQAIARAMRKRERSVLQALQADLLEEDYRLGRPEKIGHRVTIAVEPSPKTPGRLRVALTYVTPRAEWVPLYDARQITGGSESREKVALTGIALIRQSTGEDWSDVELVATTARPPLSEPPPDLALLVVAGHQGAATREVLSAIGEVERLSGTLASSTPTGAEAIVEHTATGRVTIPSTNRPVRVELFSSEVPCRSRLEVAPIERPVAILVAELENRTGRALLPGKVNVFRGPNYSGQTEIGFISPNERFQLPLGTDASLRIRTDLKMRSEKKAAITGTITHVFELRTVLENSGARPVDVLVRDRIPVSRTDDASVKVTDMEQSMEVEEVTGLTSLPLTIAPHSRREIATAYRITASRGFRIVPPE